jgi:DNA gyrase/topoisomerase IV subunit B
MREINLSDYILVAPESIIRNTGAKRLIDIEVEDNNTFYIKGENDLILTHNCDGSSIVGLLINFLYKYWPELFDSPMVFKAETPIVVSKNNKSKKKISFYTQEDYVKWLESINTKEWDIEYKKGLAALVDDEYSEIINNPILTQITTDDLSKGYLNIWFGKDSELRKIEMLKE